MALRNNDPQSNLPQSPKKASWKQSTKSRTAASGKYYANVTRTTRMSNGVRLFLVMIVMVSCGAVWSFLMWNRDRKTPIVSLIAVKYAAPWAPNSWAIEDVGLLNSLNSSEEFSHVGKIEEKNGSWDELLDSTLQQMKAGGPGGSLVLKNYGAGIVYLSAHGAVNGDNRPCLLFSDAKPLMDSGWLPLEDVLKKIDAKAPKNARLLVVIDAAKQPPDVRTGMLSNRFVERAIEMVHSFPRENMAVLFSSGIGQDAWTSPELGSSFFGFLFHAGLNGFADQNNNGRLKVTELAAFLAQAVDSMVKSQRGQSQVPVLAWSKDREQDFEIARAGSPKKLSSAAFTKSKWERSLARLRDACNRFERWSGADGNNSSWEADPIAKSSALASITRAGQLLMAGSAYEEEFDNELKSLNQAVESKRFSWESTDRLTGRSLAWIDRNTSIQASSNSTNLGSGEKSPTTKPPAATPGVVAATPTSTAPAVPAPPSEKTPSGTSSFDQAARKWIAAASQTPPNPEPIERPTPRNRDEAVKFCVGWISESSEHLQRLPLVMQLIPQSQSAAEISREEAFLKSIELNPKSDAMSDLRSRIWFDVVKQHQLLEAAIAVRDPRATPRMKSITAVLCEKFRSIRDWSFTSETSDEADQNIFSLLTEFKNGVERVATQRDALEQAWKLSDDLAFEIPLLIEWSLSSNQLHPAAIASLWSEAGSLHKSLTDSSDIKDVETKRQNLENAVKKYLDQLHNLVESNAIDDPSVLGELARLVRSRSPRWSREYIEAFDDLASAFASRSRTLDAEFSKLIEARSAKPVSQSTASHSTPRAAAAVTSNPESVRNAEGLIISLVSSLDAQNSKAFSSSQGAALEREFRSRWVDFPSRMLTGLDEKWSGLELFDPEQQEKSRGGIRELVWGVRNSANFMPRPATELSGKFAQRELQVARQDFILWQSQRWIEDFWKTPEVTAAGTETLPFFAKAASDWIRLEREPKGPIQNQQKRIDAALAESKNWFEGTSAPQVAATGNIKTLRGTIPSSNTTSGTGWIGLRSSYTDLFESLYEKGRPAGQRLALKVSRPVVNESYDFSTAPGMKPGDYLLEAWYRGHTKTLPLNFQDPRDPFKLEYAVAPQPDAKVLVHGPEKQLQIVMILDCSNSFIKEKDDPHRAARSAIAATIRQLPPKRTELALIAFGHSVDYPSDPKDTAYRVSSKWPSSRRPWDDIEVIADLQSLAAPGFRNALEEKLERLEPHGRTPLYLSINEAVNILNRRQTAPDIEKRIVVLTDGKNDVHARYERTGAIVTGGLFSVPAEFDIAYSKVENAVLSKGIRLDIVGYYYEGVGQDDLRRLASKTGGSFIEPKNERELSEQLEKSLFEKFFEIRNERTRVAVAKKERLDSEVRIDSTSLRKNLELEVIEGNAKAGLQLLGGEVIELLYQLKADGTSDLRFLGIPNVLKTGSESQVQWQEQGHRISILRDASLSRRQILLGLERQDSTKQTIRPDRVLVEVRGSALEGEARMVRLGWSDGGRWERGQRTPVLAVPYSGLSKDIGRLEARMWIANQPPPRTNFMPLTGLQSYLRESNKMEISYSGPLQTNLGSVVEVREKIRNLEDSPMMHLYFDEMSRPDVRVSHSFTETEIVHELVFPGEDVDLSKIRVIPTILNAASEKDGQWSVSSWMRINQ